MVGHIRMGRQAGVENCPVSTEFTSDPDSVSPGRPPREHGPNSHKCCEGFGAGFTHVSVYMGHVVPSDWNSNGKRF